VSERETPEVRALLQLARRIERQRDELADALREYIAASDECVAKGDEESVLRFGQADDNARAILARIDAEKSSNERGRG
jgi:hypothetical protein